MSDPERGGSEEWNRELERALSVTFTKRQVMTLRAALANELHASAERIEQLASLPDPEPQDKVDHDTFANHVSALNEINDILARAVTD